MISLAGNSQQVIIIILSYRSVAMISHDSVKTKLGPWASKTARHKWNQYKDINSRYTVKIKQKVQIKNTLL